MRITLSRKMSLVRLLSIALTAVLMSQFLAGAAMAQGRYTTHRALGMLQPGIRSSFRFAVASDSHIGYGPANKNTAAALDDMVRRYPDLSFLVHMGDLVETGAGSEYELAKDLMSTLPFPVMVTPGNHEARWQDPQTSFLRQHFGAPNTSFNCGAWHFVVLDTSYPGETLGTIDPATLSWLEEDLSQNPGRPIAVFSHHPLLYKVRDFQDSDDAFARIMDKYPVRVVFSGHGHSFITWTAQGQIFQMVGALMDGAYAAVNVDGTKLTVATVEPGPDGAMKEAVLWQHNTLPLVPGSEDAASAPSAPASGSPVASLSASYEDQRLAVSLELAGNAEVSLQIDSGDYFRPSTEPASHTVLGAGLHRWSLEIPDHAKGTHTLRAKAVTSKGPFFASVEFEKDSKDLLLWRKGLGSAVVGDLLPNGTDEVIAGTRDGLIRCMRLEDGKTVWEYDALSQWGGGVLDGDRLYFGTAGGNLECVNARDGTLLWRVGLDRSGFAAAPALATTGVGKLLIAGSTAGKVHAVHALFGGPVWRYETKGAIQSSPAVSGDKVFVGAWDGCLYALNSATGDLLWATTLGRQVYYSPYLTPAVSGNRVFTTTPNDSQAGGSLLHALDALTGHVLWKAATSSTFTAPAVAPGRAIIVGESRGSVSAFSQHDGALMWSLPGSSTLFTEARGNGFLYVSGGYKGVLSLLTPEERYDYVAGDGFLFVNPLVVPTSWDSKAVSDQQTLILVADTRGRLTALSFTE